MFPRNRTRRTFAAGNRCRLVLVGSGIIASAGGCASYQPASIGRLGGERMPSHGESRAQSDEIAESMISVDVGDAVRVTMRPHQRICGRIDELTDDEMVLMSEDGGDQSRISVHVTEIDRLEVLSSSRATQAIGVLAAIFVTTAVWAMTGALEVLR